MNTELYTLDVAWDVPHLPRLIGPFKSRNEANDWAAKNIPNGSWEVRPLAPPYSRGFRL